MLMCSRRQWQFKLRAALACFISACFLAAVPGAAAAVFVTDDNGRALHFSQSPKNIVSLVPAATEIICALDAARFLAGVTYNDVHLSGLAGKPVVGGVLTPQPEIIKSLAPDLLILTPEQFLDPQLNGAAPQVMVWSSAGDLAANLAKINRLASLWGLFEEARALLAENQAFLDLQARKIKRIPAERRLRTARVMAGPQGRIYGPGRESFQSELIRAAGGLPPDFGGGQAVEIGPDNWRAFNPQAVYGCAADREVIGRLQEQAGWREVEAFKNGLVFYLPCPLIDRPSPRSGYAAAWLSSLLYADYFAQRKNLVQPETILGERALELPLDYVRRARIVESRLNDFVHRTLLIDFTVPQDIVSTLDGPLSRVETVGNAHTPVQVWAVNHLLGLEAARARLFEVLGLEKGRASLLFTGADLNNLAVKTAVYQDMAVTALITAGVEGNALRTSRETGAFYEPGTINIIALTNRRLSPRAMTRAIITITEAKTAALWDMDIRGVAAPLVSPATGTGTDEIIVVAGQGPPADNSGGHAKLGELLAKAVYDGVQEALWRQNGKLPARDVFTRLEERGCSVESLIAARPGLGSGELAARRATFAARLLDPRYQGFLQAAFSLGDAWVMGQLTDLSLLDQWALQVAGDIAGRPLQHLPELPAVKGWPPPLAAALKALAADLDNGRMERRPQ